MNLLKSFLNFIQKTSFFLDQSLLELALVNRTDAVVSILLDAKVTLSGIEKNLDENLEYAVDRSYLEMVIYLLNALVKKDPKKQLIEREIAISSLIGKDLKEHITALLIACYFKKEPSIALLINHPKIKPL